MKQKLQEYLQKIKKKLQDSLQIIRQKLQDSLLKIKQWLGNQKLKSMPRFSPKLAAGIGIFLAVFVAVLWFFVHFSVHEVIVLGNIHYTKEEITDTVQRGLFGNNTLIVSRTHKSFSPDTLDLVDEIEVEMKDEHTLQITVQERQLIGYVQYLDCNLYFDSEGRVMNSVVRVEKDEEEQQVLTAEAVGKTATSYVAAMKEAPEICGLDFPWARLHEVLPIEDTSVFNTILGISRMINKYSIFPDTVEFDEEMNISLLYGELTVNLGTDQLMEEKLARVAAILPSIEGKQGILHMEDYDGSSENIVFSQTLLAAEDIDDEEDETAQEEEKTEEDAEGETVSHEYALVIREDDTEKSASGGDQTQSVDQKAGISSSDSSQPAAEDEPSESTDQTTGTAQTDETAQLGMTDQTTENKKSDSAADATQQQSSGTQEIQINKPVLNNLP